MSRSTLRPSPNEEAQMVQEELQRRRKLRILQVREQEKANAIRIRRATQEKHEQEINVLAYALEKKWKTNHQKLLKESEKKFASCLEDVGSAHDDAKENAPNQALKDAIAEKHQKDAEVRGILAIKHEKRLQRMREQESIEIRRKRHVAMIKERVRAKHIASLPLPHPNPADYYLDDTTSTKSSSKSSGSIPSQPGRYATIRISDHESTMTTTVTLGVPSDAVVERATTAEMAVDAREEAEKEGERIALLQAEKDKASQECMEKARVRHQAALEEARLDKESKSLMNDLKHLTMKDGLRRQHHIDYRWDDNIQAKKACQELFGQPGSRFKESEMLSHDLHQTNDDSGGTIASSFLEETEQSSDAGWKDVTQEEDISRPGPGRALNRLMKQIQSQRQQQKTGSGSSSNFKSKLDECPADDAVPETSKHLTISSCENNEVTNATSETEVNVTTQPTSVNFDKVTDQKLSHNMVESVKTEPATCRIDTGDMLLSPLNMHKKEANAITEDLSIDKTSDTNKSSARTKSQSDSLLESSLENMKNDEVLLKSVKDFQQRLLQQHKSCAKIQEQIGRLESKRAAIDAQVEGVTK